MDYSSPASLASFISPPTLISKIVLRQASDIISFHLEALQGVFLKDRGSLKKLHNSTIIATKNNNINSLVSWDIQEVPTYLIGYCVFPLAPLISPFSPLV